MTAQADNDTLQELRLQYANLLSELRTAMLKRETAPKVERGCHCDDYHLIDRFFIALDIPKTKEAILGLFGAKPTDVDLIAHRTRLIEVMGHPANWTKGIEDKLREIYNLDFTPLMPPLPGTHGRPPEQEVLEAMHNFGGSFVRQLAMAWQSADMTNKAKLHAAFSDYYRQYEAQIIRHTKAGR